MKLPLIFASYFHDAVFDASGNSIEREVCRKCYGRWN